MDIVEKILEYSNPYNVLQEKVKIKDNSLLFNNENIPFNKPILISVGKASLPMARFFSERIELKAKLIVTPKGTKGKENNVIEAGHPLPDENSIKAGKKMIELLTTEDYDLVIFAISGGASALVEYSEISLDELRMINKILVTSGIGINKINIVRKHLSKIKGGKILEYIKDKIPVVSFIVSDVPGNDISSIGSGLTSIDTSTNENALEILKDIGLERYSKYLTETPKSVSRIVKNYIILDNMEVLKKVANILDNSFILTSEIRGEARDVGAIIASIYNSSENYNVPLRRPYYLLLGGEPEVTIQGKAGKGGRNGEVCLSFLKYAKKGNRFELLGLATDGVDGNSEYAGCKVTSDMKIAEDDIDTALETHNSYGLLENYGGTIKTGYTHTNVNNIYVLRAP
ncbi:MAG: glycerate 2-kinase [Saccharolobus sp.]|uniref:glycerate 2-kinase n=2 Tax=Sulfolobaceae TaxID=118883 RepID=UPI001F0F51B8|nr:glycerate 2-kinase [Saccharolobus shibatae]MCH4814876.1 glycerate kinase [Saccharolobus shibatae]